MGLVDGKVAFVSGAARGQGRSHAVRMAAEGADVVVVDLCDDMPTVEYPLGTESELDETVALIEGHGRRAVKVVGDVRSFEDMERAAALGLEAFGKIDIVLANAGIESHATTWEMTPEQWREMIDVNLTGVFHTVRATVPSMVERGEGGSIVLTSSTLGLRGYANQAHYTAAKHGVVGLMKVMAAELGAHRIRANAVCPVAVRTGMIINDAMFRLFNPEKENPTEDDVRPAFEGLNALDVPWIEASDVTDSIMFLCSEQAKFITGVALPVDAGCMVV